MFGRRELWKREVLKRAAVEGKSCVAFITGKNDRPLGVNMPADLLSERINFYICGFGTKYASFCFFFFLSGKCVGQKEICLY